MLRKLHQVPEKFNLYVYQASLNVCEALGRHFECQSSFIKCLSSLLKCG